MSEGWKPIETAPRDQRDLLLWGQTAGEVGGINAGSAHVVGYFTGHGDYPGFHWRATETDAYAVWVKPTHWMPLPNPPLSVLGE